MVDRGDCDPLVCNPTGPHDIFGSPLLATADTVRLLVILASLGLVFSIGMAWQRSLPHGGQRMRYLSLALFAAIVIGTELENLGNIPSYRLAVSACAVVSGIIGLWKFRNEEPVGSDNEQEETSD
jgi:hypothetical protein